MNTTLASSLAILKQKSKIYQEHVTQVSNEIKSLEGELQSLNIGLRFDLEIGEDQLTGKENEEFNIQSIGDWKFIRAFAKESIAWDRDQSSGKFRILYSRIIYEERVSIDGDFSESVYAYGESPNGISERKPLIECPIERRLKCYSSLIKLVQELVKEIDSFVVVPSSSGEDLL